LTEKARALAGLRRFDDAVEAADRALLLAGEANKSLVRHLRVRLLTMAGRHADAEQECNTMLKDAKLPADVLELRYLLSSVYAAAKQGAKAEEQLLLILKADPDNATANNDLGYQWAEQNKNLAEAERMIRKAIEADRRQRMGVAAPALPGAPAAPPPIQPITPVSATSGGEVEDNAAFVDSLGWVLLRRGQIDKAREELERASRLPEGADPVIFDHLGDVYYQLKLPAEARRAWEHALELYDRGERPMDSDRCQDLRRKIKMLGGGS
jgi:tetratricopeptide (TPR) repeat protein